MNEVPPDASQEKLIQLQKLCSDKYCLCYELIIIFMRFASCILYFSAVKSCASCLLELCRGNSCILHLEHLFFIPALSRHTRTCLFQHPWKRLSPGIPGHGSARSCESWIFKVISVVGTRGFWIKNCFIVGPWRSWIFICCSSGSWRSWIINFCIVVISWRSWIWAKRFRREIMLILDIGILFCRRILWIVDPYFWLRLTSGNDTFFSYATF